MRRTVSGGLKAYDKLYRLNRGQRGRLAANVEAKRLIRKSFMVSTIEQVNWLGDGDDRFVALLGRM